MPDLPIDRGDGGVECIDVLEVQLQQKTMVIGHPTAQRFAQRRWRGLNPAMGEAGQSLRIALAVGLQPTGLTRGDQSLDHPPAAQPDDIVDHPIELDLGVVQRLLQPLDMAAAFASKLLRP